MFKGFEVFSNNKPEQKLERPKDSFAENYRQFDRCILDLREKSASEDISVECGVALAQLDAVIKETTDPQERGLFENQKAELEKLQHYTQNNKFDEAA